jgi:quinol monooxygenase YgiN
MVLEQLTFAVKPEESSKFPAAAAEALKAVRAAKGCISADFRLGIENLNNCLLLVQWESMDAHMAGFRQSEGIKAFGAALSPFFASKPAMEHYGDPI